MTTSTIEIIKSLRELAFIVESVAHLQGKEHDLLPAAERARALVLRLEAELLPHERQQEEEQAVRVQAKTSSYCHTCGRKHDMLGYCPKCDGDNDID